MKKTILLIITMIFIVSIFVGCTEAENVSQKISNSADSFNVSRRLIVVNTRTDKIITELIGTFSLQGGGSNSELHLIVALGDDVYEKHIVYINDDTTYFVEDLANENVPEYFYKMTLYPKELTSFGG